jgi:hypothetical protein
MHNRCLGCGKKTADLKQCSKAGCDNQLCLRCLTGLDGNHCGGCFVSWNVMHASSWAFDGQPRPSYAANLKDYFLGGGGVLGIGLL